MTEACETTDATGIGRVEEHQVVVVGAGPDRWARLAEHDASVARVPILLGVVHVRPQVGGPLLPGVPTENSVPVVVVTVTRRG